MEFINLRVLKLLTAEILLFASIMGGSLDEFTRFVLLGLVGFVGGYVRSWEMKKVRSFKNVMGSCLVGMILTWGVIGLLFQPYIMTNPIRCFGISALIGYFQPNISNWFNTKILGIPGE